MSFVQRFRNTFESGQHNYPKKFVEQLKFEAEGAEAAFIGKKREQCPYVREQDNTAWNFWVYGNDMAWNEIDVIRRGFQPIWSSTAEWTPEMEEQYKKLVRDTPRVVAEFAIEKCWWHPRYVSSSDFSTIRRSSL
jgi:hypothetical protein